MKVSPPAAVVYLKWNKFINISRKNTEPFESYILYDIDTGYV
jgi:hypothetical protein